MLSWSSSLSHTGITVISPNALTLRLSIVGVVAVVVQLSAASPVDRDAHRRPTAAPLSSDVATPLSTSAAAAAAAVSRTCRLLRRLVYVVFTSPPVFVVVFAVVFPPPPSVAVESRWRPADASSPNPPLT